MKMVRARGIEPRFPAYQTGAYHQLARLGRPKTAGKLGAGVEPAFPGYKPRVLPFRRSQRITKRVTKHSICNWSGERGLNSRLCVHSTVCCHLHHSLRIVQHQNLKLVPEEGIEPPPYRLKGGCSSLELRPSLVRAPGVEPDPPGSRPGRQPLPQTLTIFTQ